ncbi:hypothetical protein TWF506_005124 [Arthrobotrys conoides]|uniref:F-box domain-containing protein n=1 Tax=Arthrobotrys conoides TaxID=74498 RepID=A0AAN8NB80_9PEZI
MNNLEPLTISGLPREILSEIIQYLPLEDVKSFSVCSKQCRIQSLSNVFQAVEISQESAKAFKDDGSLSSLVTSIRHAILRPSNSKKWISIGQFHDLVTECRETFDILQYFTNLEIIEIADFKLAEYPEFRLLCSTFKKLATYPLSKKLKTVHMVSTSDPDNNTLKSRQKYYLRKLFGENKIFIESGMSKDHEFAKFPPGTFNLEELSLNICQIYIEDSPWEDSMSFGEKLMIASRMTLKRLDFDVDRIVFSPFQNCIFPAVKYLNIRCERLNGDQMTEIGQLFPNLEDFRVRRGRHLRYIGEYTKETPFVEIGRMSNLRRIFLPQPEDWKLRYLSEGELDETVEYWMGKRPDRRLKVLNPSPLTMLEQVEFYNELEEGLECCITDGNTRKWRATTPFPIRMQNDPMLRPVGWDSDV